MRFSFRVLALSCAIAAFLSSSAVTAMAANQVPLGADLGGSGPVTARTGEGHPSGSRASGVLQLAHEGHADVHVTGTVNAVDPAQHKIKVSHNPIPAIGWPAMTMEFGVAPSVDLRGLKPGTRIDFTMEQAKGGMYEVQSVTPAGGAQ